MGRIIEARYAGTCKECGGRFAAGARIRWAKGQGSTHKTCPATPTKATTPKVEISREEAIRRLVEMDVCTWGESEREAAMQMRRKLSHGEALLALAGELYLRNDKEAGRIEAMAHKVMTRADWRRLRAAQDD